MLKQKNTKQTIFNKGFTLIELMVVIAIIGMLAGVLTLNLNSGRNSRLLSSAENELVAHIREAQSYTLSSRLLPNGQPAQYYIIKFDKSKPTQYTLQGIYDVSIAPKLVDIFTVNLPANIIIASNSPISITQRLASPATQDVSGLTCGFLAFAAPFGKPFFNNGCTPTSFTSPYTIASGDDYKKMIDFVTNVPCSTDPVACTLSTGSVFSITLTDKANAISKTVTVNGITGSVTFN